MKFQSEEKYPRLFKNSRAYASSTASGTGRGVTVDDAWLEGHLVAGQGDREIGILIKEFHTL